MTPRERRHERTKEAILQAAARIIAEKGAGNLSMRALAKRIDYSPAGLYEYFGSKEEIITAVCLQGHRRLRTYLEQVDPSPSPGDYLLALGLAYVDFALQNPDHYLLMFTFQAEQADPTDLMQETSAYPLLLQAVENGIATGEFQARDGFGVAEMAYAAWSLVHGIAMLRLTYWREAALDFGRVDREALLNFSRGLQVR